MTPKELKALRQQLGLTQKQLAKKLGGATDQTHVSRWERGLRRVPDWAETRLRELASEFKKET